MKKKRSTVAGMERQLKALVTRLQKTPTNVDASAIIRKMGDLNVAIADAKRARKNPRKRAKKKAPAKRAKKRAAKKVKIAYVLVARRGTGPRMLYDGGKFSQTPPFKTFSKVSAARARATKLIRMHPVLRKYRVTIETEPRPR